MADRMNMLREIYRRLDQLPLSFGMTGLDENLEKEVGGDLNDALREVGMLDTSGITEMTVDELRIQNRAVYHILRRFRNSASVNFKYSTGTDGKSVDKTQVPKILKDVINEYDAEFIRWRSNKSTGSILKLTRSDTSDHLS